MFSMQCFHRSSWTREPWRYLYLNQQNILPLQDSYGRRSSRCGMVDFRITSMIGGISWTLWWIPYILQPSPWRLLHMLRYITSQSLVGITWKLIKSYLLTVTLSLLTVQWLQTQGNLGNVAPHTSGRGSFRHRQHLQLSTSYLALHGQFSPRSFADIIRTDASGHPEVPLHLLPGVACLC